MRESLPALAEASKSHSILSSIYYDDLEKVCFGCTSNTSWPETEGQATYLKHDYELCMRVVRSHAFP